MRNFLFKSENIHIFHNFFIFNITKIYVFHISVQNNIRLLQYKRQLVGMLEILAQRKSNMADMSAASVQPDLPVQPPPFPQVENISNAP